MLIVLSLLDLILFCFFFLSRIIFVIMAMLKSGVIVKLLEDIKDYSDEQISEDGKKPVLLQIRSIIPVLEEGDLWPNKGFYLKVSDMSHAIFVSISQEDNELVMNNKLQLGQFIYVQNFEKARPLPLLRGISPVPGRHTCEGSPKDILCPTTFSEINTVASSDIDSIVEKGVISEKKFVDNQSGFNKSKNIIGIEESKRADERTTTTTTAINDEDSDSDGGAPSSSSMNHTSRRKSWTTSDILRMKETFDSSVIKHEIKPAARRRCRSATASPVRPRGYDSSDENSSSIGRRRDSSNSSKKLAQNSNKIKNSSPKLVSEQASSPVFSIINDWKQTETVISWNSLPSRLLKLGKEVVRQRDIALNTAADALQEACAAERLLNSLSTYSDFIVAKGDDREPYADKFFDLQDDLYHTKLIIQSLTNISPLRTSETDTCGISSVKEALKVAVERKKDATSWIKTAVAVDLSPCSMISPNPRATPIVETHPVKKSTTSSSNRVSIPKGAAIIKRSKTSDDMSLMLQNQQQDKDINHSEWGGGQGSSSNNLSAASDLVASLEDECRKLFLGYVEKYLDEVERKICSVESDSHIAGIMSKVKRVSDWLDVFIGKKPNSTGYQWCTTSSLDESEMEAYGRVRNKIYGILLKHVERTALILESINASPIKL